MSSVSMAADREWMTGTVCGQLLAENWYKHWVCPSYADAQWQYKLMRGFILHHETVTVYSLSLGLHWLVSHAVICYGLSISPIGVHSSKGGNKTIVACQISEWNFLNLVTKSALYAQGPDSRILVQWFKLCSCFDSLRWSSALVQCAGPRNLQLTVVITFVSRLSSGTLLLLP